MLPKEQLSIAYTRWVDFCSESFSVGDFQIKDYEIMLNRIAPALPVLRLFKSKTKDIANEIILWKGACEGMHMTDAILDPLPPVFSERIDRQLERYLGYHYISEDLYGEPDKDFMERVTELESLLTEANGSENVYTKRILLSYSVSIADELLSKYNVKSYAGGTNYSLRLAEENIAKMILLYMDAGKTLLSTIKTVRLTYTYHAELEMKLKSIKSMPRDIPTQFMHYIPVMVRLFEKDQ